MIDLTISLTYQAYYLCALAWDAFEAFANMQIPYVRELATVGNAINGTLGIYASLQGQPTLYWLHSLILTVMGSFGGGLIAPLFLGKPAAVFTNDLVVFACIVCWYFVHYLGGSRLLNWKPIRMIWSIFVGLFRTSSVIGLVAMANSTLSASKYYPIPLFGPILSGTLVGSMSAFLPLDKGLAPIAKNTPWPIQAAFMTATFYHLMIHDTQGIFGVTLRSMLGTYTPATLTTIIAIVQIAHIELQLFLSPDVNLFTPFHKIGYLVFQVEGPKLPSQQGTTKPNVGWDLKARNRLKVLLEISRVLIVLSTIAGYIFLMVLPVSLPAVPTVPAITNQLKLQSTVVPFKQYKEMQRRALPLNGSIGRCQWFQPWRQCQPAMMKFEQLDGNTTSANNDVATYRLAVYEKVVNKIVYEAAVANLSPIHATAPVAVKDVKKTIPADYQADPSVVVNDQGFVYLMWEPILPRTKDVAEVTLWFYPLAQVNPVPSSNNGSAVCGQLLPANGKDSKPTLTATLQYITPEETGGAIVGVCAEEKELGGAKIEL